MHNKVIGHFFFAATTATATIYPNMMQHFVEIQLNVLQTFVIFQHEDEPPYWE